MELTQLNNNTNLNQITDIKNSLRTNNLENTKGVSDKYPSDNVDLSNSRRSSSFLSNITSNISKVASLQKAQSTISNQLEITSEIVKTTQSASNSSSTELDDKQPDIKILLDSFNKLSEGFTRPEISNETGIYFDGQLGSKPLSSHEILDASEQQRERLSEYHQAVSNEIKSLVNDTRKTIDTEKTTVETKVEFKNIDYAKESAQFNSSTLGNIRGGVLPSQANAFPLHSEKLLA